MNGIFITGTDTEVGKTFVSASLLHSFKTHYPHLQLTPRKPIASGCIWQADQLVSEDALSLQQAAQSTESLATICPYQFEPAISPERAIRQAGLTINIQDLTQTCQNGQGDLLLVEGAGGFYSPLARDGTNADLAKQLGMGVILVVGNRLGCINHFLLTQAAIQAQELELVAVVVNDITDQADPNNLDDLQQHCRNQKLPCLHLAFQKHSSAKQGSWPIIPLDQLRLLSLLNA